MNEPILIKSLRVISTLAMLLLVSILGMVARQASFAVSTSGNATQTTSSFSTSSIVITFDLPTAAVVTFVLILLGLAAGLLLMARLSFTDHVVVG
jgi:hypothetical protein